MKGGEGGTGMAGIGKPLRVTVNAQGRYGVRVT